MDLSAEQFIEIVTSAGKPASADSSHTDQRRQQRVDLKARATIIPFAAASQPSALIIQVRDLSQAGIGFLHNRKMSLDEQFALVLPRSTDTPSVVLCSVAFWQPLGRDLYAIGARFTRVLRDGGTPPLPIQFNTPCENLASEIQQLHRKAS